MKTKIAEQVLDFLAKQRLDPTPRNYTLGYMLLSRSSAAIEKAVRSITDDGVRLTQEEADQILDDYCAAPMAATSVSSPHDGEEALLHQMLRFGDIANDTRSAASAFGRDLGEQMEAIAENPEISALVSAMMLRTQRSQVELEESMAEISRLRQDLECARDDANRDKLSGLPNRRALDERLAEIDRKGKSCAIAICDIDRFKSVNDTHGHAVGDRVIRAVGQSIAEQVKDHMVGRWGGEEFMVIMEGLEADEAGTLIDNARTILGERNFKTREGDQPVGKITFSAGVAVEASTAQATNIADARLYIAKESGRDRVITTGGDQEEMRKAA